MPDFASLPNARPAFYYLAVIIMLLVFAGVWRLVNSRIGKLFVALQQNEELAASTGINIARLRVIAYAISCFLGGVAGAVFSAVSQSIYPSSFTTQDSINFMLNCFLGGLGYVFGPDRRHVRAALRLGSPLPDRAVAAADLFGSADRADAGASQRAAQPARRGPGPGAGTLMPEPILQVHNLTKRYGGLVAVNNISFDLREREIL